MAKLLLVEDQEAMRRSLTTLLSLDGHLVLTAENLAEAQRVLLEECVDLVLLDVFLSGKDEPETSGYEILDFIQRTPALNQTQVIMTSGMDYTRQTLEAGADGFLQKPYMPEDLQIMIQDVLSQRSESDG
jgi:CheY-like chemotaxis protein